MVKWTQLSPEEFEKKYGKSNAVTSRKKTGEPDIIYSYLPTSRIRLHELYHATEEPLEEYNLDTVEGRVFSELSAEDYAYSMKGKDSISTHSLQNAALAGLEAGGSPARIMGSMDRSLSKLDYTPLNKETRQWLWNLLRSKHKSKNK